MRNYVAKNCNKFNKAKVEESKKSYKRTIKHKLKHDHTTNT